MSNSPEFDPATFDTLDACLDAQTTLVAATQRNLAWLDSNLAESIVTQAEFADSLRRILIASPLSKVRVLLQDDSHFWRRCPRLVTLLTIYGHLFELRLLGEADRSDDQRFLLTDAGVVRRYHPDALRGELSKDSRTLAQCRQHFDSLWQRAEPPQEGRRLGI